MTETRCRRGCFAVCGQMYLRKDNQEPGLGGGFYLHGWLYFPFTRISKWGFLLLQQVNLYVHAGIPVIYLSEFLVTLVADRALSQLPLTLDPQRSGFQDRAPGPALTSTGEGCVYRAKATCLQWVTSCVGCTIFHSLEKCITFTISQPSSRMNVKQNLMSTRKHSW